MHDSEVVKDGQQVLTVCAFIHYNFDGIEKVFLPKRASTKKFLPNVFELPGGHVDFGEEFTEALAREIDEEFGMKVNIGDIITAFTYDNPIKKSHSAELIYFATFTNPIEGIKLHPEDHSEYRWVSKTELRHIYSIEKDRNDPEFVAIRKAFDFLDGLHLNFA